MDVGHVGPVRVVVTGGRDYTDKDLVYEALDELLKAHGRLVVIQGGARGADAHALAWAKAMGQAWITYPALWKTFGDKSAGPIRNEMMLQSGEPDLVIAFPGGKGTADMLTRARKARLPIIEIPPRQ